MEEGQQISSDSEKNISSPIQDINTTLKFIQNKIGAEGKSTLPYSHTNHLLNNYYNGNISKNIEGGDLFYIFYGDYIFDQNENRYNYVMDNLNFDSNIPLTIKENPREKQEKSQEKKNLFEINKSKETNSLTGKKKKNSEKKEIIKKNIKPKHTGKDNDFQKICTACLYEFNESINKEIKSFLDSNNIVMYCDLCRPAITPLPHNIIKKIDFINNPILIYYLKYIKPRLNEKRKKNDNENILNFVFNLENSLKNIIVKRINNIFITPFRCYLLAFVRDENIINVETNDLNFVFNFKFKTLKDCFNGEENKENNNKIKMKNYYYSEEAKEKLKNYTLDLFKQKKNK